MKQHAIISNVSGVFCIVVQNQTGVGVAPNVFKRDGTLQVVEIIFLTFMLIAHERTGEGLCWLLCEGWGCAGQGGSRGERCWGWEQDGVQ